MVEFQLEDADRVDSLCRDENHGLGLIPNPMTLSSHGTYPLNGTQGWVDTALLVSVPLHVAVGVDEAKPLGLAYSGIAGDAKGGGNPAEADPSRYELC